MTSVPPLTFSTPANHSVSKPDSTPLRFATVVNLLSFDLQTTLVLTNKNQGVQFFNFRKHIKTPFRILEQDTAEMRVQSAQVRNQDLSHSSSCAECCCAKNVSPKHLKQVASSHGVAKRARKRAPIRDESVFAHPR